VSLLGDYCALVGCFELAYAGHLHLMQKNQDGEQVG
jgi:hypothetical protein